MSNASRANAIAPTHRHEPRVPDVLAESAALQRIARASALDESTVHRIPGPQIEVELRRRYELAGELTRIPTEKDDTFRLASDRGRFLVKVSSAAEGAGVVDLQSEVMLHLERTAPSVPAQRLVSSVDGEVASTVADVDGRPRMMRVMRYVEGTLLSEVTPSAEQFRKVGATLARLDDALVTFRHPEESRSLIWDLCNFVHTRPLLDLVVDRDDAVMGEWVFDQFEALVNPRLQTLDVQMIHGDYSPFNVVVDPSSAAYVTGVIDFGDAVRSPTVFDLAVAVANQIGVDASRPWATAFDTVRGYRSVRPLPDHEIELLAVAGPARLLLRALIVNWRAAVDPRTRDYGMSHSAMDWQRLRAALSIPQDTVRAALRAHDTPSRSAGEERS